MDAEEWRARVAQTVAQQVRRYRLERGLSVQKFADICTEEYGLPLKRSVLANFEGGRRPALSLAEVLVFARILQVPPVQLLFPIGQEPSTEVLPDNTASTWEALKWFTGETDRLPGDDPQTVDEQASTPVRLYREHDRLVEDWQATNRNLMQVATSAPGGPNPGLVQMAAASLNRIAASIAAVRKELTALGLAPPNIAPGILTFDIPADESQLASRYEPLPDNQEET